MVGFLENDHYYVESNKESGLGRFDLALIPYKKTGAVIIFECKHSQKEKN